MLMNRYTYLITNEAFSGLIVQSHAIEFSPIICLEDDWRTNDAEELIKKPCNSPAFFGGKRP